MKYKKLVSILLFFLLLFGTVFAQAGANRKGTAGAAELMIPVGARGISMAGSAVVDAVGVDAIYWNPANLARSSHSFEVSFSHMEYLADIGVEYGALGLALGEFGSLGLSIKALSIGDIVKTTNEYPDGTGQTFSPQFVTIGLTYSKLLSDRVSVGLTANYISETLDLVSASGLSFDIGVAYSNLASVNGLSLAVTLKNLGPDMKFDGSGLLVLADQDGVKRDPQYYKIDAAGFALPTTLEIGLGYQYSINDVNMLQVASSFTNHNFYEDEYKFGLEYAYNDFLFVRGGYTMMPELDADYQVYGLTAGVGLNYMVNDVALKFDYAFRDVDLPGADAQHIVTLGLGF
ncbi:MAG: PorV/PorQ family protein [Melioribacteraceae bacterium]|nr:PorV/PorQ family protein [Melioribacteraceae bacterium]